MKQVVEKERPGGEIVETVLGERQAVAGVDSRKGDLVRANCHRRKENAKSAAKSRSDQDSLGQFHPTRAPLAVFGGVRESVFCEAKKWHDQGIRQISSGPQFSVIYMIFTGFTVLM